MEITKIGIVIVDSNGVQINNWHVKNGTGDELKQYALRWAIKHLGGTLAPAHLQSWRSIT